MGNDMEQIKIDNLRFADLLSKYTGISKTKIDYYLKSNSIDNIFAHPTSITINKSQTRSKAYENYEIFITELNFRKKINTMT